MKREMETGRSVTEGTKSKMVLKREGEGKRGKCNI